jgi:predicted TIM-barrel fold metal-dependent hydrolase
VLREHVRVSTQPMDLTPGRGQLAEALETAEGMEDMLCFASDYPHFDNDNPGFVARRIPESWWPKVFHDNTLKVMRWPKESAVLAGVTGNAG